MQPYTIPPAYVVNAPAEFMRQFGNRQVQSPTISIDVEALKLMIQAFISMLESYYVELLKLSPEEAKNLLSSVSAPPPAAETVIEIDANDLDKDFQAHLSDLAKLSSLVYERLTFIANREAIDEDSEEYQSFLVDMAQEIIDKEGGKKIYGKDALLALFD